MILHRQVPEVFEPLLAPSRYKGAYGGRGSGKSHFFGEQLVEDCLAERGMLAVCIREVQKSLKDSSKRLIEAKLRQFRLGEADGFKVFESEIRTPGDGVIIFQGMADHTAESIKSLEGFKRAWIDEGQALSARSLQLLRPTIRAEGSEIWASWNPRRKTDAVDEFFRQKQPNGCQAVRANWSDNPFFNSVLDAERLEDFRLYPDRYEHVWEGGYAKALEGAYYASALSQAKAEGRIGRVAADPLMTIRLVADIGGTGARADSFAMWACQFVGREIRWLDYYESQGQPLAAHLNWMRGRGYTPDRAQIWLPHDGASQDKVFDVSYESALRDAGYFVTVVPNQGRGAAAMRIEAMRRLFPRMWFNEDTTEAGREALGYYHERKDEVRGIGLGPDHDWSSHGCDAAGLACIIYDEPQVAARAREVHHYGEGSWMG